MRANVHANSNMVWKIEIKMIITHPAIQFAAKTARATVIVNAGGTDKATIVAKIVKMMKTNMARHTDCNTSATGANSATRSNLAKYKHDQHQSKS